MTTPEYWQHRHRQASFDLHELLDATAYPWFPVLLGELRPFEGQRFIELGCAPGRISALICGHIHLHPEGVDFSPEARTYLRHLAMVGVPEAMLHQCDFREFRPDLPYDVVASFGLVEHFGDVQDALWHHDRVLRRGGLCVVVVPHFRKVQYLYHYLFDRSDLRRHNIAAMDVSVFEQFARRCGHRIMVLGYFGRLRCWGEEPSAGTALGRCRSRLARGTRRVLRSRFGPLLPEGSRYLAPWLMYIAQKGG